MKQFKRLALTAVMALLAASAIASPAWSEGMGGGGMSGGMGGGMSGGSTPSPSPTPTPTPAASAAPYIGPLPTSYSDRTPALGDVVVISGLRLNLVSHCTIDGVAVEITNSSEHSLTVVIPEDLNPGLKDIVMTGEYGVITAQGPLTVQPAVSKKTNAGSFDGRIAVYAKGHKGKTLTWKIAGKWVSTTITSDFQRFQRFTAAEGVHAEVHLYLDGEKHLTKIVETR